MDEINEIIQKALSEAGYTLVETIEAEEGVLPRIAVALVDPDGERYVVEIGPAGDGSFEWPEEDEESRLALSDAGPEDESLSDAWKALAHAPDPWWDNMSRRDRAAYLAETAVEAQQCHASFATGPAFDPYLAICDRKDGHKGLHEGWEPVGGVERMRWTGGGSCMGERLPVHNTATFRPNPVAQHLKSASYRLTTFRLFLREWCKQGK